MVIGIYKTLITLVFPVLKATYIRKRRRTGKEHPVRFNERLGLCKRPRPEGKLYWMHGASVGEAVSMLPLIDKLLKEDPELSIMVTTGTLTSAEIMAKRLPPRAFHQFIPFDVPALCTPPHHALLERFKTPEGVIGHIAGITGLAASCDPATPEELLQDFDLAALPTTFPDLVQVRWE